MGYTLIPDEYGRPPHLKFDTPMDFVQYVQDVQAGKYPELNITLTPETIRQAQDITQNPDAWEMSGGHPTKKPDWLARNLPWLGPTIVGGGIAAAALPGLLAGSGAASGGASAAAPTTAGAAGTAGTTAGAAGTTAGTAGTTAGAGGLLPSYGATPAMQVAGSSLPSVTASGTGASVGGGSFLSQIGSQFKNDPLGSLGKIGDQLGKGAQGAAQGRREDAYAEAAAGRVNLDALALDQKRAVLRSLLGEGGLQDASISRPAGSTIPTFQVNGGLRPSALTNRPSLLAELGRPAPTVRPPVAGAGEKWMGIGGGILGMLGSLSKPRVKVMDEEGIAGHLPRY